MIVRFLFVLLAALLFHFVNTNDVEAKCRKGRAVLFPRLHQWIAEHHQRAADHHASLGACAAPAEPIPAPVAPPTKADPKKK
jgi:hypothetical protein